MEIKIMPTATVEFKVNLELTEKEARAWDAIVGYGWEAFERVFKEHLGTAYIQPYEKEAKKMFEDTRQTIGFQLHAIGEIRKAMTQISNKDFLKEK